MRSWIFKIFMYFIFIYTTISSLITVILLFIIFIYSTINKILVLPYFIIYKKNSESQYLVQGHFVYI